MRNPFRCFNSSPDVIRLTVMLYIGGVKPKWLEVGKARA
jgi:hypothetical protein